MGPVPKILRDRAKPLPPTVTVPSTPQQKTKRVSSSMTMTGPPYSSKGGYGDRPECSTTSCKESGRRRENSSQILQGTKPTKSNHCHFRINLNLSISQIPTRREEKRKNPPLLMLTVTTGGT